MSIHKKLLNIQTKLKVPKGQRNNFGNYNYRNCEEIMEAVKPLMAEENCTLFLFDEIQVVENRFYVKATANFIDVETGQSIITTASAREEESKKGMDGSQVTGASSSYARKYALNGLFCIDDTKDSDTTNDGKGGEEKKSDTKPATTKEETTPVSNEDAEKLENGKKAIDELAKKLVESGIDKKIIGDTVKENFESKGKKSANYNAIKDVETATKVYKALKKLDAKEEKEKVEVKE